VSLLEIVLDYRGDTWCAVYTIPCRESVYVLHVFHKTSKCGIATPSDQIVAAFVYGSVARQEENRKSDIDLMIIGRARLEDVLSHVAGIDTALGRALNPTVYSLGEFKSKLDSENHFLTAVMKGKKVFLIGSKDELRKVVGVRMVKARAYTSRRN